MPGSTPESPDLPPRYAVDELIEKLAPGISVRELERRAGLKEGALGNHLKPTARGKVPRLNVIERFAHALNTDITSVSRAFAADSYAPPGDLPVLPDDEMELIGIYRRLCKENRALARQLLRTLAGHQDDGQPQPVVATRDLADRR